MATVICLPDNIKYDIASWNSTTHGNVTFVIVLLSARYVVKPSDASYNDEKLGYCSDLRGLRVLGEQGITTDKKRWAKISSPRRFLIRCVWVSNCCLHVSCNYDSFLDALINNINIVNLRLST